MVVAAIFGDIGGHSELFAEALENLGCDVDAGTVPEDLTIIQVGDLVDRGPDSDGVVEMVDRFIRSDQWVQLDGNHEARFLGGPKFFDHHSVSSEPSESAVETLQGWKRDGHLIHAVAVVRDAENGFLVTHGGMHRSLWLQLREPDVINAAKLINDLSDERAYRSGIMLHNGRFPRPDDSVGVVWAATWDELIVPWQVAWNENNEVPPFHQVHGHCTLYHWGKKKYHMHPNYIDHVSIDTSSRMSQYHLAGKKFFQVDPGLGQYASFVPKPLIIEDVEIVVA